MSKIFVSIPVSDKPELKMMFSLYKTILSCQDHQVKLYFNENDSLISRVRNAHLSVFVNEYKDFDYFMSIDSDLEILNCFSNNNLFSKLISHDKDFVGGLYALKQHDKLPMCSSVPMDKNYKKDYKDGPPSFDQGLIRMKWLSSGCWCLKREAIMRMVEEYKSLHYTGDDNMAGKPMYGLYIPGIYEVSDNMKKYLSEDWSFCQRWLKIGGEIYADTSIVLNHIGKVPYSLWNLKTDES